MNLTNAFQIIYIGNTEPFLTRHEFRMELFNEACVSAITYHLFMFTDALPSITAQYIIGWSLVVTLSLMLFGNSFFVIRGIVKKLRLLCKRRFKIWQAARNKKKAKKQTLQTLESIYDNYSESIKISHSDIGPTIEAAAVCRKCKETAELIKIEPKEKPKKKRAEFKKPMLKKQIRETKKQRTVTDLSVIKEEQSEDTYINQSDFLFTENAEPPDLISFTEQKNAKDEVKKLILQSLTSDPGARDKFMEVVQKKEEEAKIWKEHKK